MTNPLVSCFGLEFLGFEENYIVSCQEALAQIRNICMLQKFLTNCFQTIPDCIRYIIGVFCYYFKSQMNILVHINTLAFVKAVI